MKTYTIDLETGGLNPYINGICSISIKEYNSTTDTDVKTWWIKPQAGKLYGDTAFKVNKLMYGSLDQIGVSINTALHELKAIWQNQVRIIGHNVEFDLKFLIQAFREFKIPFPSVHYICTKELANNHLKKTKKLKSITLIECYKYFHPKSRLYISTHESETDVLMCEGIFKELWQLEDLSREAGTTKLD